MTRGVKKLFLFGYTEHTAKMMFLSGVVTGAVLVFVLAFFWLYYLSQRNFVYAAGQCIQDSNCSSGMCCDEGSGNCFNPCAGAAPECCSVNCGYDDGVITDRNVYSEGTNCDAGSGTNSGYCGRNSSQVPDGYCDSDLAPLSQCSTSAQCPGDNCRPTGFCSSDSYYCDTCSSPSCMAYGSCYSNGSRMGPISCDSSIFCKDCQNGSWVSVSCKI